MYALTVSEAFQPVAIFWRLGSLFCQQITAPGPPSVSQFARRRMVSDRGASAEMVSVFPLWSKVRPSPDHRYLESAPFESVTAAEYFVSSHFNSMGTALSAFSAAKLGRTYLLSTASTRDR